jgi:hypothetical protein
MATVHRTTTEEIAQLAVPPDKPRSPYDDLLDDVAQGQPMRVESTDPKDLRGAKVSISRLAKRRGVPITYQTLTNGFAVLPDEATSKPIPAPARRRRTRRQDAGETRGA